MSKPKAKPGHPRRAYSYIRFSSALQAEGGSLTRQAELSATYCQRKGLDLDETLTLRDLGVSAFHGDNVKGGRWPASWRRAARAGCSRAAC